MVLKKWYAKIPMVFIWCFVLYKQACFLTLLIQVGMNSTECLQ